MWCHALTAAPGVWMSLCFSGTVRNPPPHIGFLPLQHWSENQTPKHNTSAHTCKFFISPPRPSMFSSHFDFLSWSLSFPISPCQLWCTLWYSHQFFLWSTSLHALDSLLCIQLTAAAATLLLVDLHIYETRKTYRCWDCMHTHMPAHSTCCEVLCWKKSWTAALGEYWKTVRLFDMCSCRLCSLVSKNLKLQ